MGVTRKLLSISTLGLVNFRSTGERQALYSRQTRDALLGGRPTLGQSIKETTAAPFKVPGKGWGGKGWAGLSKGPDERYTPQAGPPAGWYPDSADAAVLRYWDGHTWTEHTAAKQSGGE